MAVVQISRIQLRRGRKQAGSGLPQLASGELGWAIDTQELFIGNGSVAEGAPYVGNTKILSEHDNLFEFASNYTYKTSQGFVQTGSTANSPIIRSLQDRLDDRVSIRAFGAEGDGTNQTVQLQRAIDQLFLNPANVANAKSRVTLYIEPGIYNINSTIYVPPYATIEGAGSEKTIFNFTGTGTIFQTVNSVSTVGSPASDALSTTNNQAREISLKGFTISSTGNSKSLLLQSCRDSVFEDIRIVGNRQLGDAFTPNSVGIQLNSLSSVVTCKNNIFRKIRFEKISYAVYSDFDITENKWTECKFETLGQGFAFGENTIVGVSGQFIGPYNNTVELSTFNDVEKQGIRVIKGTGNLSHSNRYYLVGNDGGNHSNPVTPVLEFEDLENLSNNDWFERTEKLITRISETENLFNVPYIPEVKGPTIYQNEYTGTITVISSPVEYTRLLHFPADTKKSIEVEYIYKNDVVDIIRQGVIKIAVDPGNDTNTMSDDFEFVGNESFADDIIFTSQNYSFGGFGIDTVALMMLNSLQSEGLMYFRVKTKS